MTDFQLKTLSVGVLVGAVALATAIGPHPVLTPFPALVLLPAFAIGGPAVALPPLLFWLWSPQLFKGALAVPRRSAVLLGVLTALTPLHFFVGWEYGVRYDGRGYVNGVALLNAAMLVLLWIRLVKARSQPSFNANLVFHGLLFGWLGWCAFPNLGELP